MNYDEFKKAALSMFDGGFLVEEDPAIRKPFKDSEEADAVIRRHFEQGATRESASDADDELTDLFAQWMSNGRKFA